ncbi:MAG: 3-phosphoshikimate 1-carboxyvinyltransferase [Fimbriimonadaceae bacterium]
MNLEVHRAQRLTGTIRPPSDKSLTHRAYILAALAKTPSTVLEPLEAEDCQRTLKIVLALGSNANEFPRQVTIEPSSLRLGPHELDCGNSGTTMRLMAGALASEDGLRAVMRGDESLSRRPMNRIVEPLRLMGAEIAGETPPLKIVGSRLRGIAYRSPVASAQVKSCLLLAGLRADGETWVTEPSPSRDHTERMLGALGVAVERADGAVGVVGGQTWDGFNFHVPADVSSAAFFLCAAAAVPGSSLVLTGVGVNHTRTGVLEALAQAGATVTLASVREAMGEPVADITVTGSDSLRPFEVSGALVPRLIDEIPVLAVLATQCHGTTKIRDAKELRVKESDRIESVAANLAKMGAKVETFEDGLHVTGPTPLRGAVVDATGDHRIGMAFAVAGLLAEGRTTVTNADSIRTSYPDFQAHLDQLTGIE